MDGWKGLSVPIEYEAGWAPELVLDVLEKRESLTPCWD